MKSLIDALLNKKQQKYLLILIVIFILFSIGNLLHVSYYVTYYNKKNTATTMLEYYRIEIDSSVKSNDMRDSKIEVKHHTYVYPDGVVINYNSTIGKYGFPTFLSVKQLTEEDLQELNHIVRIIGEANKGHIGSSDKLGSLINRQLAKREVSKIVYYEGNTRKEIYPIERSSLVKERDALDKIVL